MNLHLSTPRQSPSFSESPTDLARLLERCRGDLLFAEELLSELENPQSDDANLPALLTVPELKDSLPQLRQKLAARGAEVIRRLTSNIEALSPSSQGGEVRTLLRDLHNKMVRCLKLLPANRQN